MLRRSPRAKQSGDVPSGSLEKTVSFSRAFKRNNFEPGTSAREQSSSENISLGSAWDTPVKDLVTRLITKNKRGRLSTEHGDLPSDICPQPSSNNLPDETVGLHQHDTPDSKSSSSVKKRSQCKSQNVKSSSRSTSDSCPRSEDAGERVTRQNVMASRPTPAEKGRQNSAATERNLQLSAEFSGKEHVEKSLSYPLGSQSPPKSVVRSSSRQTATTPRLREIRPNRAKKIYDDGSPAVEDKGDPEPQKRLSKIPSPQLPSRERKSLQRRSSSSRAKESGQRPTEQVHQEESPFEESKSDAESLKMSLEEQVLWSHSKSTKSLQRKLESLPTERQNLAKGTDREDASMKASQKPQNPQSLGKHDRPSLQRKSVNPQAKPFVQGTVERISMTDRKSSSERLYDAHASIDGEQHLDTSRIQRAKLRTVKRKLVLDVSAGPSQLQSNIHRDITPEFRGSLSIRDDASTVTLSSMSGRGTGQTKENSQMLQTESMQTNTTRAARMDTVTRHTPPNHDGTRLHGSIHSASGSITTEVLTEVSEDKSRTTISDKRSPSRLNTLKTTRRKRDTVDYLADEKMHRFLGTSVPHDTMNAVHHHTNAFFDFLRKKLTESALRRGSSSVSEKDVILFIRSFKGVTNIHHLFAMVEEHMSGDLQRQMVPSSGSKRRRKNETV